MLDEADEAIGVSHSASPGVAWTGLGGIVGREAFGWERSGGSVVAPLTTT